MFGSDDKAAIQPINARSVLRAQAWKLKTKNGHYYNLLFTKADSREDSEDKIEAANLPWNSSEIMRQSAAETECHQAYTQMHKQKYGSGGATAVRVRRHCRNFACQEGCEKDQTKNMHVMFTQEHQNLRRSRLSPAQ